MKNKFKVGSIVYCYAPAGWGGHQTNLLKKVSYKGTRLCKNGFPIHGFTYVVRGHDHTCDGPSIYLKGIKGSIRPDGTECSFSENGFLTREEYYEMLKNDFVIYSIEEKDSIPYIKENIVGCLEENNSSFNRSFTNNTHRFLIEKSVNPKVKDKIYYVLIGDAKKELNAMRLLLSLKLAEEAKQLRKLSKKLKDRSKQIFYGVPLKTFTVGGKKK